MVQKIVDLLASEDGWEGIVVFGAHLGEDRPVILAEQIDKEHARRGAGLPNRFGSPMLLELYEQEVIAELLLGDGGRIASEVLVNETDLAVIGMPGSIGIVAQGQMVGQARHRLIGVIVVHRVGEIPGSGADLGQRLGSPHRRIGVVVAGEGSSEGRFNTFHVPES
jgi:hypothetical protein